MEKRSSPIRKKENRLKTHVLGADDKALENARLLEENQHLRQVVEERNAELAMLQSVQEGLVSRLDVQSIYDLVGDKIREIFRNMDAEIRIYDPKANLIRIPYITDMGKRIVVDPLPFTDFGISSYVLRSGQTLVINENILREMEKYGSKLVPGGHQAKSAVFVPLVVNHQARGLLVLGDVEREHAFSESDVRLLETLANSMSTALENARLFDDAQHLLKETEQRAAELAIINSVQEGLASKLDVQAIYDLVGDKIRDIFHAQGTAIYLFDHKTEMLDTPYCYLKKRFEIESRPFSEHPIAKSMVNTLQPITYRTVEEYRALGGAVLENSEEYKSGMYVPLMVGKEIKGMVGIANLDKENAYNGSDLRLLQTLANSMSVALENARLFDETQRLLKETEQRNAELAIINSIQQGLAAELDFQALVDLVGDKLRQVFGNSDVTIGIYDPKTDFGSVPYIVENGQRLHIEPFKIEGRGFTGELIRNPRTILINQNMAQEMERFGSRVLPGTSLAKSMLDVPLVVGGVLRGKLQLQDMNKERAFTDSDVRLLETIASSMSVALENARLFDETQRLLKETEERNAELAIITSVQRALASKLEIQAIYDLVGDKVRDVFDAQGVGISYYDRPTNFIRFPYCLFRGERITEKDFELGKGLTSHIIQSRQPLLINENAAERYKELGAIFAATESEDTAKSWLGVPLIAGGQVTGVIQLENYEREFAYSDSDVRLLTTLANSMSVALENARLFDEVQKKNAEITEALERETASNDILRVIAESPTDIQPVLEVIARNAAQLSGSDDAIITLRAGDILYVDAHYGAIPTFPAGEGIRFNRDSVAGRAILDGRPLQAIHNQPGAISQYPEGDKIARKYGYRMSCAVPLLREGKAIGAISIRRLQPELLTEKHIVLVQSFANQAAIAVENVRLFNETTRLLKETEQRNAELAIINSVQAGLASKLDIQAIYDLVGDKISEIFDAPAVFISNYDLAANRAYYPYYSIERKHISLEPRPPSGAALEIIRTRQPVFLQHDAEKRLVEEYKMPTIPGTPDAESYLLMPMIVGSRVKGGIGVMSTDRQHPLDDSSVRLLQTIASSMSVALENARLFDETQRLLKEMEERNAELALINSVQSALVAKLNIQGIYDAVGDSLREIFNQSDVGIAIYDDKSNSIHIPYTYEGGKRVMVDSFALDEQGFIAHVLRRQETLVINENMAQEMEKYGSHVIDRTVLDKSLVYVPLIVGDQARGVLSIKDSQHEHAFNDSDVRLLTTIANSMSVALENARLFDETQQLFLEAKEARAAAEQANQAKSAFLSSMSHELRTPLNAIINFVEMIARGMIGPVNQEQVELLDQALHSSKHLLNLINDVLDISKIQAGQLTLFIEEQVSVQVEVEAALNMVGGLLQEKGLQLIRDTDPHLPMVSCDRRRVRQVLLNLISNAVKFTNEGTVTVSVKNQGQAVLFAVIDTGPGIPLEKQNLIFEPFIQAENSERQVQGTGLGLPISRSLVRAHGGELWVDSQHGEGSAFFFTLPVVRRSTL